jgi:hypothetical protein
MQMANERVMKCYDTSRRQRFDDGEAQTLAALPAQTFELIYPICLRALRNNPSYLTRNRIYCSVPYTAYNGTSILIISAKGCGKSYLGCALGQARCGDGYRLMYLSMQKLNLRAKKLPTAKGNLSDSST